MQKTNFSVAAQHRANREFAERKKWVIYKEYTDVGTGTDMDRLAFQQMLADAKSGKFKYIICAKFDRFSRSVIDTLYILDELQKYDVLFCSATEQFDFSSPFGKLLLLLLIGFAELFIDNLRQEVIKGQTERAAQGYWMQRLSFGYTTKKEILENGKGEEKRDEIALVNLYEVEKEAQANERYVSDDTAIQDRNATGVKLMFELAISGRSSLQNIADALHEEGYRPTRRAGIRTLERWSRDSVAKALKNRFYAGYVLYRGEYYRGNHKAILTREEFDDAQEAMKARSKKRLPGKNSKVKRVYMLSGLMICAKCGGAIRSTYRVYKPKTGEHIEYQYYRCSTPLKSGKCDLENVAANDIEIAVALFLANIQIPTDWQEQLVNRLHNHTNGSDATIEQLERRLYNIQVLFEFGELERDKYETKRNEIKRQIKELAPTTISTSLDDIVAMLQDFPLFWQQAMEQERQRLIQTIIDKIELDQDNNKIMATITVKPDLRTCLRSRWEMRNSRSSKKERGKERRKRRNKKRAMLKSTAPDFNMALFLYLIRAQKLDIFGRFLEVAGIEPASKKFTGPHLQAYPCC